MSLRRTLAAASTAELAGVVERFWNDQGYRTTRREQGTHLFVLAQSPEGDDRHLVWVDADAAATPDRLQTLVKVADRAGAAGATVVSGAEYEPEVYTAADEYSVECLAEEQLLTFVHRAGLDGYVSQHLGPSSGTERSASDADAPSTTNAVADGGAAQSARSLELAPAADHPSTLRATLVVGGGVLTLLSVWGGAAQVTAKLQTCGSGCSLLWVASFLPLAAMLLGSFAVALGVFD